MAIGRPRGGEHAIAHRPLSVLAIAAVTGFVFVAAAVNADGQDLRPVGGDLSSLLSDRNRVAENRQDTAQQLQSQIDDLSRGVETGAIADFDAVAEDLRDSAGQTPVSGPGLQVVLSDAPRSALEPGMDPNLLVVHEQDLRGFVNALWAGGAEAVSLQGQRLITTVGIKCVGTTVLLNGRSYSPPFRIQAVGDTASMIEAINTLPETVTFTDYSRRYQLGLEITTVPQLNIPAFEGSVSLQHASVASVD